MLLKIRMMQMILVDDDANCADDVTIVITSKTGTYRMSEYVDLCTNIDMGMMSMMQLKTAECQNL